MWQESKEGVNPEAVPSIDDFICQTPALCPSPGLCPQHSSAQLLHAPFPLSEDSPCVLLLLPVTTGAIPTLRAKPTPSVSTPVSLPRLSQPDVVFS